MGGRLTGETHKGTFGGDERDLYLVSDGGYTSVYNGQNSWTVCLLMFVDYTSIKLTESDRTLIFDKEGHRTLSPHRVSESNLETEVGMDYTKDAEMKNALSTNFLLHESL